MLRNAPPKSHFPTHMLQRHGPRGDEKNASGNNAIDIRHVMRDERLQSAHMLQVVDSRGVFKGQEC